MKLRSIFKFFALYPFMLPIWEKEFFRIENVQFEPSTVITDEQVLEQKKFYLSISDPLTKSRIISSIVPCENSGEIRNFLNELLQKEKDPQLLSDILKLFITKKITPSNIAILSELIKSEIPSTRTYAAILYLDIANSPQPILSMLENENSFFSANLVWKKLQEKIHLLNEETLITLEKKIPQIQKPLFLKTLSLISKNPSQNNLITGAVKNGSILDKISVAEALASRADCANDFLEILASSEDPRIRLSVARSIPSESRLQFLLKLSSDPEPEIRRTSINSLSQLGQENEHAINAIIARLDDDDLLVRTDAENLLIQLKIKENYLNFILTEHIRKNKALSSSVRVLGELDYKNASSDLLNLLSTTTDLETRKRTLYALGKLKFNESAVACANFATATEPPIRRATAFALGCFGEKSTYDTIIKLVEDKDPEVSAEALHAIAKIADPYFLNVTIASMKRVKENYIIRSAAARALAKIGTNSIDAMTILRKNALEKIIPTDMGNTFDADHARASIAWAVAEIAKSNPSFSNDAKYILDILQTPPNKQNEQIQSSEFLIEASRQAQLFLEGKTSFNQSEITPRQPELIINPIKKSKND